MIYHITNKEHWNKALAENIYKPDSLNTEGFIHCSPGEKISDSLDRFFKGKIDLILINIDESKVHNEIIWEDLYGHNLKFPHIYGELNIDAVIKVTEIKTDTDGRFIIPVII